MDSCLSLCPHLTDEVRELSEVSSTRELVPFIRAPLSRPNHLQKAPSSNNTLGLEFQHINPGVTQIVCSNHLQGHSRIEMLDEGRVSRQCDLSDFF